MEKFLHGIDTISEWSGKLVMWLVVLLTGMLGYEVVMRYAFNAPTKWAFDLSYMIGGSYFLLGQAYALKMRRHVRIDIFYAFFPPEYRRCWKFSFSWSFSFPCGASFCLS